MALTTPKEMTNPQLYAVLGDGVQPLPVPDETADFDSLYALLPGIALGVYSVLRTFDGNKFLDLAGHIARLRQSMAGLGWDPACSMRRLCAGRCTRSAPPTRSQKRASVLTFWPGRHSPWAQTAVCYWPLCPSHRPRRRCMSRGYHWALPGVGAETAVAENGRFCPAAPRLQPAKQRRLLRISFTR
jgi:hypothetical protein